MARSIRAPRSLSDSYLSQFVDATTDDLWLLSVDFHGFPASSGVQFMDLHRVLNVSFDFFPSVAQRANFCIAPSAFLIARRGYGQRNGTVLVPNLDGDGAFQTRRNETLGDGECVLL